MKRTKKRSRLLTSDYGLIGIIKENKGIRLITEKLSIQFLGVFPTERDEHFFSHTYSYRISNLRAYLGFYIKIFSFLDISEGRLASLEHYYWGLSNPSANRTKKHFRLVLNNLLGTLEETDKEISERLQVLHRTECVRLEEAINCLDSECNMSAVVMSVSAVEHRLHKLLFKANRAIYKKHFEKGALGGIISLFRKGEYMEAEFKKLKKILPDRHKPLVEMLNIYRIFSAHPKDVVVSSKTAKAIVSLAFLLLIDKDLVV